MDLEGKVAVVTGGASGIGLATARRLADRGARLVLADVEAPALEQAAADLAQRAQVLAVETDVSDKTAVDRLADATYDRFGAADVVFLNAGVGGTGPAVEATHADWQWVIGVNLWGPVHGVEAFLPRMVAAGTGGHLLLTASFAGLVPNVGMAPYCVTKYGVVALGEVLHKELREHGIGVTVLCPMRVRTNIGRAVRNRPAELGGPGPDPGADTAFDDPGMAGDVIDVDEFAGRVVDAIGTDRLYVVTHEETARPAVARRFARIDAAFG